MSSLPFNRALLRGLLAGAVVLTGTACSRSNRAETGSDNSAAMTQDTTSIVHDQTGSAAGRDSATDSVKTVPTANNSMTADSSAAGYRAMGQDTVTVPNESDSTRVTHDTAETSQAPSDSAAVETAAASVAGAPVAVGAVVGVGAVVATANTSTANTSTANPSAAEMVRDTSTIANQIDTVAAADSHQADTVAVSDTAGTLQAQVDTSHSTEASDSGRAGAVLAAGAAGAAVAAAAGGDNDAGGNGGRVTNDNGSVASADTPESERVRPPEDSTETLGNVTTTDEAVDETADEQIVNPTDEVGAAAIASGVTGAEAVALMSREGVRCAIVDPEENEAVRWDMSSTPVTLNPCGMGSMNLSKIWTSK